MSFVFLAVACLLFSCQFLFSKGYQLRSASGLPSALWMTLLDGAWFVLLFFPVNGFQLHMTGISALYSATFAICAVVCNLATYFALGKGKVAVVTLFTLAGGLLLPLIYGTLMLGETLRAGQWIGVVLILLSFFPGALFGGQAAAGGEPATKGQKIAFVVLCAVIFLSNGLASIAAKAHAVHTQGVTERDFLLFAALLRLGVGLVALAGLRVGRHERVALPAQGGGRGIVLLLLLAGGFTLCNGTGNVFSLMAAKELDASLQFPLLSGIVVGLGALLSRAVYKERLSRGDLVGLGMTAAGVLAMIAL